MRVPRARPRQSALEYARSVPIYVTENRFSVDSVATLAVGVAGAFLGGLIGNVVLGHSVHFGFHLVPFLLAVVGAVVLLLFLEALSDRRCGIF